MIKRICKYCGKEFYVPPSRIKYGKGKYCSIECRKNDNRKIERICKYCGKIFYVDKSRLKYDRGKYCSRSCMYKAQYNQKEAVCKYCGRKFTKYKSYFEYRESNGKYCSQECFVKSRYGENNPAWKGGKSFEPYGSEFNEMLKDKVRNRDNNQCMLCGITKEENEKKLDVHHINYNKNFNESINLITLCRSCHIKTNINREYWETYFETMMEYDNYMLMKGGDEIRHILMNTVADY